MQPRAGHALPASPLPSHLSGSGDPLHFSSMRSSASQHSGSGFSAGDDEHKHEHEHEHEREREREHERERERERRLLFSSPSARPSPSDVQRWRGEQAIAQGQLAAVQRAKARNASLHRALEGAQAGQFVVPLCDGAHVARVLAPGEQRLLGSLNDPLVDGLFDEHAVLGPHCELQGVSVEEVPQLVARYRRIVEKARVLYSSSEQLLDDIHNLEDSLRSCASDARGGSDEGGSGGGGADGGGVGGGAGGVGEGGRDSSGSITSSRAGRSARDRSGSISGLVEDVSGLGEADLNALTGIVSSLHRKQRQFRELRWHVRRYMAEKRAMDEGLPLPVTFDIVRHKVKVQAQPCAQAQAQAQAAAAAVPGAAGAGLGLGGGDDGRERAGGSKSSKGSRGSRGSRAGRTRRSPNNPSRS